ncbi:hypothetical protein CEXT_710841 [Caerostris extrusa]|uniref:Uncharacterized protein n=1 Tax=Caerostris extrusa TaxID=172846 RepID=A0AAV4TJQ0_CAEEX|nr:hypothetical protein CEXT_710841 [Caerostris extrusa]
MSLTISQRHYRFETRPFGSHPKPRSPLKSPNEIISAVHRNCNRNPSFAWPSDEHRSKSPLRALYPQSYYLTSIRHPKPRGPLKSPNKNIIAAHRIVIVIRLLHGDRGMGTDPNRPCETLSTIVLPDFDSVGNCAHWTVRTLMSDYLKF